MPRSPAPLPVIRAACLTLEQALRATRAAPEADLAAAKPAGADARTWPAWWRYHERLVRWHTRSLGPVAGTGVARASSADDALVFDALRSQPRTLRLTPDAAGERRTITVHAKSAHALFELHARNLLLAQYTAFVAEYATSSAPEAIDAVQRAVAEIDYQHQVCAWIYTAPGPGLPYSDDADQPTPPAWLADVTPLDLGAIARAGAEVNAARLEGVDALLAADPEDGTPPRRPSWSTFFATLAPEPGGAARLLRDTPLAELLATVRLGGDARLAAHQDAERRASEGRDA